MEDIRKQAEYMHKRLKNYIDQPGHELAKRLVHEVEQLITEIKQQKHPLTLENRVTEIIKRLEAFVDDTVMDYRHIDEMIKHSNQMRDALRKMA